jgi:hypothetical protein
VGDGVLLVERLTGACRNDAPGETHGPGVAGLGPTVEVVTSNRMRGALGSTSSSDGVTTGSATQDRSRHWGILNH